MLHWERLGVRLGFLAGGVALGHYGVKILTSKDAKTAYTHCTAAVLRMKDEVVKDVNSIKENCEDIAADAEEINDKRRREYEEKMIADAKEILRQAEEKEAAACTD